MRLHLSMLNICCFLASPGSIRDSWGWSLVSFPGAWLLRLRERRVWPVGARLLLVFVLRAGVAFKLGGVRVARAGDRVYLQYYCIDRTSLKCKDISKFSKKHVRLNWNENISTPCHASMAGVFSPPPRKKKPQQPFCPKPRFQSNYGEWHWKSMLTLKKTLKY
jgi:hypothetical protein